MDYSDILGDDLSDEGKKFIERERVKSKVINKLRQEIKELNDDIPKLFKGDFNKITQNYVFLIREHKEQKLKDILENGIKDSDIDKYK